MTSSQIELKAIEAGKAVLAMLSPSIGAVAIVDFVFYFLMRRIFP